MRCRKAFGPPKSKLARTKFFDRDPLTEQRSLAGTDDAIADALRSLAFSKCYDPAAVAAR
jgi:hypothetical protein